MPDPDEPFARAWARIAEHAGEFFKTEQGAWFTYKLDGEAVRPSQSELRIARDEFERAFPLLPVPPAKLNKVVAGPKYVWAILHDERISAGDW